jgi:mono/diheme cytochrome c family protein
MDHVARRLFWRVRGCENSKEMDMANVSLGEPKLPWSRMTWFQRGLMFGSVIASVVLLPGCAVELQNTQAAQELKHASQPPGLVYAGWRVFQDKCAACHGPAATGTAGGPDLLPRVRDMGPHQFVSLVLKRYDWSHAGVQASSNGAARDAMVDDLVQRKSYGLTMPAWEGEPRANAHIADLYAYLSARAQGAQGPGRPTP